MATSPFTFPDDNAVIALEDYWPEMAGQDPFAGAPPQPAAPPRPPSQSLQLTPDQQQRLLWQVREHYNEAMETRLDQDYRRALRYRRFMADPSLRDGLQPWTDAPQVFTSMTRATIERLVDEQMDVLLPNYERITLQGIGDEDAGPARKKQRFFRWALESLNKFRATLKDALTDAALDGLGILKTYPTKMNIDGWLTPEELAQSGQTLALLETIIQYDAVDQGTMLIPPDATGLQWPEARYLAQQLWVHPLDDFPDLRRRGYGLLNVDPYAPEDDGTQEISERLRLTLARDGITLQSLYRGRQEMVESYERFEVDRSGVREFVVVHWFPQGIYGTLDASGMLARVLLLKDALPQTQFRRPMWPFSPLRFWRKQRELRGMNVPDRLEWCQDVLNRLIEQCLEQGEIDILPFYFYNIALTGELPSLKQIKPGEGVPLPMNGSVTFKPSTSHTQHYAELFQIIESFKEEDTNVTGLTQGRSNTAPNEPRTASGLAMLLQQGNKAFAEQGKDLADQVTEPLQLGMALWQHHVPPHFEVPLPDTEAIEQRLLEGSSGHDVPLQRVPMTAQELSGPFDLTLKVNPEALLEQQKQLTMAEKLDTLLVDYPLGRRQLWKHVWEEMGLQEFDLFYPEEVAQLQTMLRVFQADVLLGQLELQLMAQQQAGLMPPPESAALLGQGNSASGGPVPQGGGPPQLAQLAQLLSQVLSGRQGQGRPQAPAAPQAPRQLSAGQPSQLTATGPLLRAQDQGQTLASGMVGG